MSDMQTLHEGLTRGRYSAVELTRAHYSAIERRNPALNAVVLTTYDIALAAADACDKRLAAGCSLGPLDGIPMLLKDNICTQGVATGCCSRMLEGHLPLYDATAWQLLRSCGAVLLGKANMDEFAMGSTGETSSHGPARNPRAPKHSPGGSSSGSAAAVAAGLVPYSLGSDTGGSIRQPAAWCGVVGFKPGYASVSRWGLVAHASSLDQIGPITTCVADAALVYDAIAHPDDFDATCRGQCRPAHPALRLPLGPRRVGVIRQLWDAADSSLRPALDRALANFAGVGVDVVDIDLPTARHALLAYYIIACAEAASNLARYDGLRYGLRADTPTQSRSEGFGGEVKRRILLGNYLLGAEHYEEYYARAHNLRRQLSADFADAFAHCDALLAPAAPGSAPLLGEHKPTYLHDLCTAPASLAGLPAISVPCGVDAAGLPVGLQLIGPSRGEAALLNLAWHAESAFGQTPRMVTHYD